MRDEGTTFASSCVTHSVTKGHYSALIFTVASFPSRSSLSEKRVLASFSAIACCALWKYEEGGLSGFLKGRVGRNGGQKSYIHEDIENLIDVSEEVLPLGLNESSTVTMRYNENTEMR